MIERGWELMRSIGSMLYEYYLEGMEMSAITENSEVTGTLGKTGLQWFVNAGTGLYAVRFLESQRLGLTAQDLGKPVKAQVISGLDAPNPYLGYVFKVQVEEAI